MGLVELQLELTVAVLSPLQAHWTARGVPGHFDPDHAARRRDNGTTKRLFGIGRAEAGDQRADALIRFTVLINERLAAQQRSLHARGKLRNGAEKVAGLRVPNLQSSVAALSFRSRVRGRSL